MSQNILTAEKKFYNKYSANNRISIQFSLTLNFWNVFHEQVLNILLVKIGYQRKIKVRLLVLYSEKCKRTNFLNNLDGKNSHVISNVMMLNPFSPSCIIKFSQLEPILFIKQVWENFTFHPQKLALFDQFSISHYQMFYFVCVM